VGARRQHRSPRFQAWAERLWRRPVAYGAAALVALVALALPILELGTSPPARAIRYMLAIEQWQRPSSSSRAHTWTIVRSTSAGERSRSSTRCRSAAVSAFAGPGRRVGGVGAGRGWACR
jgi:uncharacterized membrane protein YgcG